MALVGLWHEHRIYIGAGQATQLGDMSARAWCVLVFPKKGKRKETKTKRNDTGTDGPHRSDHAKRKAPFRKRGVKKEVANGRLEVLNLDGFWPIKLRGSPHQWQQSPGSGGDFPQWDVGAGTCEVCEPAGKRGALHLSCSFRRCPIARRHFAPWGLRVCRFRQGPHPHDVTEHDERAPSKTPPDFRGPHCTAQRRDESPSSKCGAHR